MKLTDYTDYTLRTLIFLGLHRDELVTIQEIADGYGISKNHLMKIVHRLSMDGIVDTVRGRSGGVRLKLPPEEIRIGPIVRAAEQDFTLVECFGRSHSNCTLAPACELKSLLHQAMEAFFGVLDDRTLADVIRNADQMRSHVVLLRPSPARA